MLRVLALVGLIAIVAAVGAAVYLFEGFYDVAANSGARGLMDRAIERIRDASVSRRATVMPPTTLNDQQTIQAGARQFSELGCVKCHGAPGIRRDLFGRAMNPGPPGLKTLSENDPAEIFWIVKNGIRMTGMPSFGKAGVSDDKIWEVVAFVKKLQAVSADNYKAWTAAPPR